VKRLVWAAVAVVLLSGCTPARTLAPMTPAGDPHWAPRQNLSWQIQLTGVVDPSTKANVFDLDPYATPAEIVGDLDAQGRRTVCHLDVGVADTRLPDQARLSGTVLGSPAGAGRYWLDIRRWDVIEPVLADRFALCKSKKFQAVDADMGYGYAVNSGFDLTPDDQITYDEKVATLAHRTGLAVAVRTNADIAARVEPFNDFSVVDGCFTGPECARYFVYVDRDKAVFDVETAAGTAFCGLARAYGFVAIRKRTTLDAFVEHC